MMPVSWRVRSVIERLIEVLIVQQACSVKAVMIGVLVALSALARSVIAADCLGLAGQVFGDASILKSESVSVPAFIGGPGPGGVAVFAPFCRVQGVIKPSADSDIKFEVWLPPAAAWNDKYQGVGNGGFAGSFPYSAMSRALEAGYAVSSTDTGHTDSTGAQLDTRWAVGHPEKLVDYAWRAIHDTALISKAIVKAYYSKTAVHSFFVGCSTGGRQALTEAQRFPTDYDGIIAGAPGQHMNPLMALDLSIAQAAAANPDGWLSSVKLNLLNEAVLAACDAHGGVVDEPRDCRFDPAHLACKAGQTEACLSPADVSLARLVYSGLEDATGRTIYPGFAFGGELSWNWAVGSRLQQLASGYFGHIVLGKSEWDFGSIRPAEAFRLAREGMSARLDAVDPDLRAFQAAGGKLLEYHGWSDPRISPFASIQYYETVVSRLGGIAHVRSFYRLFMAPGMAHCTAGPGPNAVGGAYGLAAPSRDPEHDVVVALSHWVEDGVSPEQITATLYAHDDPGQRIVGQRPWCAYPARARYAGHGDRSQASSYRCVSADARPTS
jgi:feruloyl esterase